ncbi:DUF1499 domain-containing protein [Sulfitobacter sp. S0837]|uniref:DUF1499 domain-containing protein n=1 Tax=Sulfitobacter maritimus TaxID=2741719 RepID=UPI001583A383|nr:DUF1499 domain-containing protein [Sulfitobacter maritimus]NUH64397.1 DUF1499 domain-containing protein [Sulfitobacter maritimus]
MVFWLIVIALLALLAYVRFAPTDVARWHQKASGEAMGETRGENSVIWREPAGADLLTRYDAVIQQTPRTERIAGSVETGQATYVTRTALMGYPDYTTIGVYGENPRYVEVYGRSRFGKSDMGVNAKRVAGWRAQVEAGR